MHILFSIAQFLLVTGIAFAIFVLLASHIRFQRITRAAGDIDPEETTDADALTAEVAHRLGTAHREPEPFGVVLFEPVASAGHEMPADLEPLLRQVETTVKSHVRANDAVFRHGPKQIGVLLWTSRERIETVVRRLQDQLQRPGGRAAPAWPPGTGLAAGMGSHPENGSRTKDILQAVHQALDDARSRADSPPVLASSGSPATPPGTAHGEAPQGWLDGLTGVLREDRLTTALQRSLSRHRKEDRPLSLLLLDVDHLDRYNEHYGREAGDALLKGVAGVLQHRARESDLIGRMEGDSFLLIMDCAVDRAMPAAQRLLNEVRKTPFAVPGGSLRVNASIGVAGYPDHAAHPRDLARAARYALRAAKRRGGGRFILYEPAMQTIADENPKEIDTL
ncbi:MAG: diguanylate cyclase [Kiritimatiellae bacterium]|nr:diguanylate cyclase [Kiritimatiellia bacterium]